MSRLSDEVGVALAKEACPICCKPIDGPILIGRKIGKRYAENVNKMNGQLIGWSKNPCPDCQKLINEGCFFIIGVDGSKTDDPNNPYRSGHIVGISKECEFYKLLSDEVKEHNGIYMDYRDMKKYGFIQES